MYKRGALPPPPLPTPSCGKTLTTELVGFPGVGDLLDVMADCGWHRKGSPETPLRDVEREAA